ncbi:hypothetical protein [Methanoculleus sp.]|uniref:hypothetical protein n=1 Tax=Methanoculleus sp. TaxID=90427 RepID=UPI001BD675AE|nr:hypothetical protein [Methanoculleus sp.]
MDLADAVAMILALVVFAGLVVGPIVTQASPDVDDPATNQPEILQSTTPRNLSTVVIEIKDRLSTGRPLNTTTTPVPEAAAEPVVPDGSETAQSDENITLTAPDYDDDELSALIETSSVSLMLLAVQNAYALYTWDEASAAKSAATLQGHSQDLLNDLAGLNIPDEQEDVKTAFTLALESYVTASETVQEDASINRTQINTALLELRRGSKYLREAFEDLDHPTPYVPQEITAVNLSVSRSYVDSTTGEELMLLQRYVYDDRNHANDISLILKSAREIHTYYLQDGQAVVAEPGRAFLLVEVKVTNLGHKGDSRVYSIRTPEVSAFTLDYHGTAYTPIQLPSRTSLGESYCATTLERYGNKDGYIIFDVPEALALSDCTVEVNLGSGISPVWMLGRAL